MAAITDAIKGRLKPPHQQRRTQARVDIDRRSFAMTTLSLLPGEAVWRSRKVQYYAGDWTSIQTVLPEFELKPFSAGPDEPANRFHQL
jgi:hypothetical protein